MERYWVVGGIYSGMDFKSLKEGAQQMLGPFETRDEASQVWKKLSQETRAHATARFAIASERLVMPA
jgi:hypothetical protein